MPVTYHIVYVRQLSSFPAGTGIFTSSAIPLPSTVTAVITSTSLEEDPSVPEIGDLPDIPEQDGTTPQTTRPLTDTHSSPKPTRVDPPPKITDIPGNKPFYLPKSPHIPSETFDKVAIPKPLLTNAALSAESSVARRAVLAILAPIAVLVLGAFGYRKIKGRKSKDELDEHLASPILTSNDPPWVRVPSSVGVIQEDPSRHERCSSTTSLIQHPPAPKTNDSLQYGGTHQARPLHDLD